MIQFREFRIHGLFGESNVRIPIRDNRLIIVGYNGVGKSTVLNAFYYLLSQQWRRLSDLPFEKLELRTADTKLSISRSELHNYLERRRFLRRTSPRALQRLQSMLSALEVESIRAGTLSERELRRIAQRIDVPTQAFRELQLSMFDFHSDEDGNAAARVNEIQEYLDDKLQGRIIYLPTYRRIEKDLKSIFPEIEEEIQRAISKRVQSGVTHRVYVELVNFGMEDVSSKVTQKMDLLRSNALSLVSNLTTNYLRDVIRNEANTYSPELASTIDRDSLKRVFSNMDSRILSDQDKAAVYGVVDKIKQQQLLTDNERYVAHYVAYLMQVSERMASLEKTVIQFSEICNSYLFRKELHFDNSSYKLSVRSYSGSDIELEDLSSGEKQIVSLFSHLVLDDDVSNYIIIDEPELSLSVDWQQRFLSDISGLRSCNFLGAVTHSPFIFENELDRYVVDLVDRRGR